MEPIRVVVVDESVRSAGRGGVPDAVQSPAGRFER
jgi:hypothetical protein